MSFRLYVFCRQAKSVARSSSTWFSVDPFAVRARILKSDLSIFLIYYYTSALPMGHPTWLPPTKTDSKDWHHQKLHWPACKVRWRSAKKARRSFWSNKQTKNSSYSMILVWINVQSMQTRHNQIRNKCNGWQLFKIVQVPGPDSGMPCYILQYRPCEMDFGEFSPSLS